MSGHVASHTNSLQLCHGASVTPSDLLPSDLRRPAGSNLEGMWTDDSALFMMSFRAACHICLPSLLTMSFRAACHICLPSLLTMSFRAACHICLPSLLLQLLCINLCTVTTSDLYREVVSVLRSNLQDPTNWSNTSGLYRGMVLCLCFI